MTIWDRWGGSSTNIPLRVSQSAFTGAMAGVRQEINLSPYPGPLILHPVQAGARLPVHQRHDRGRVHAQAGGIVKGMVHQLGQQAALFAAHYAGADPGGEDVGNRLADEVQIADGAAGFSVHSGLPLLPLPGMTPLCRWPTRLIPAATTSSVTVTVPVTFWLPVWGCVCWSSWWCHLRPGWHSGGGRRCRTQSPCRRRRCDGAGWAVVVGGDVIAG